MLYCCCCCFGVESPHPTTTNSTNKQTKKQLIEAGGADRLAADPSKLKEAVVFAAATGALTCSGAGAMAPQPTLDAVHAKVEEAKAWHNFW